MKKIAPILMTAFIILACVACTKDPIENQAPQPTKAPALTISNANTPSITFDDGGCIYSGPEITQPDQFIFQWVNNSQQYAEPSIYAIQVEEGISPNDLVGMVLGPQLEGVSSLRYETNLNSGPWTKEIAWDLTGSARYQPRPVYFLCTHKINGEIVVFAVAGPVEVNK